MEEIVSKIEEGYCDEPAIFALYRETKRQLDELTILHELSQSAGSAASLEEALDEITGNLIRFFHLDELKVFLCDETGGRGQASSPPSASLSEETGENAAGILIPLEAEGKTAGSLFARRESAGVFSREDRLLLEKAASHLARIIENARSEQRYRAVVESALDGVCVIGEDFRLIYVNDRMASLLAVQKEDLAGADLLEFLDEKSREFLIERYLNRKNGLKTADRYEINLLTDKGEVRNVEVSSAFIRDHGGNLNEIAFLKDITERKKMEEQLAQTEKLRALGTLASGVAHDFNNALYIILGNTQLLLLTTQDKDKVASLKVIERTAKDAAETVRRLQEFTKNKLRAELHPVDLNAVAREAIKNAAPKWQDEARAKGITIDLTTRLETVPPAEGNDGELKGVIGNLIVNAVEAMPEGGRIEIGTFERDGLVCLEVSDTGCGMSEEVKKKIFEPFFTTRPYTNTGLGLSMAHGIIKRSAGRIGVESEAGKGATFTVYLKPSRREKDEGPAPAVRKHEGARILVIDDEEEIRKMMVHGLSLFNYQVDTACDGEEGLRLFAEKRHDVVLTDLGMPSLSGWEVCKAIKQLNVKTPVGMITGWGMEMDEEKERESGVDFIVSKPLDFANILNIISRSLGGLSQ